MCVNTRVCYVRTFETHTHRYFVDPSRHNDFIDAWRKVEDQVRKEKGNCVFDLKKTMDDDVSTGPIRTVYLYI